MVIIERGPYLQHIESLLGKGGVVVLTGHRRSGKTCLLESLAGRLAPKGNVIYLDMENPDHADIRSYEDLHSHILTKVVLIKLRKNLNQPADFQLFAHLLSKNFQ